MGADLQLESEKGRGCLFHFEIALAPAIGAVHASVKKDYSKVVALKPGLSVSALIVDDIEQNRAVLSQLLQGVGVQVDIADSGSAALAKLEQGLPDIIFLDIRMPEMDGTEVARRVHEKFGEANVKLVAISASVLRHEQEGYLRSGFSKFISKPFRIEEVCESIESLLKVQFDREEKPNTAPTAFDRSVFEQLVITKELQQSLQSSAELYSTTELREALRQLAALNPGADTAIEQLLALSKSGGMEKILELLSLMKLEDGNE